MTINPGTTQISIQEDLDLLTGEISECRKCDRTIQVTHAPPMNRGGISKIFIVGVEPGRTEISGGQAFSGPAGKRLMKWLIQGGLGQNREEVFNRAYFTSICKCKIESHQYYWRAAANCFPFLKRQIDLLGPNLFITLGNEPIQFLFDDSLSIGELVGNIYREDEIHASFFPILPPGCLILPLPHPSPLSRWTNDKFNNIKLTHAIDILRREATNA